MKTLNFKPNFNSILCLNGEISQIDIDFIKSFHKSIPIIAVDGAANKLYPNILPEFIIGDLDSLNLQVEHSAEILKVQNQNKYDFEKALDFASQRGYKSILILGINGGEYEHSINNWSIFLKYSDTLNLYCFTQNRIGTVITESTLLELKQNDTVSIIPANEVVISSKGLKWELNKTVLKIGKTEGARNCAITPKVELTLHSGHCVVFADA